MKKILNLGCGKTYIKGAVNIDFYDKGHCDQVVNLDKIPWPWDNNSVDEIYMLHFIEHFDADKIIEIFKEAHRVLKPAGLLHIQCPHFSSMLALTDTTHKRAFSTLSFGMLEGGNFVFEKKLFGPELIKIKLLTTIPSENNYIDFDLEKTAYNPGQHPIIRRFLSPVILIIQFFIDLSPILFERVWCHWVGGADEIIYRGRKA